MNIDINKCDLNQDYFHFTNKKNINSILNNGLIPQIGTASKIVNDRPNVSISKGGKGIIGIINSFLNKLSEELKISQIPEEYKKYFKEIDDFNLDNPISLEDSCKAMIRKLQDEVYFRVLPTEKQLEQARIPAFSEFDINIPTSISKNQIDIVTDSDNKVLSAYDVARYVYDRAKNLEPIRHRHGKFFYMFEMEREKSNDIETENKEKNYHKNNKESNKEDDYER
ncbi:MAG: hypothetical protein J6I85_07305 [Clostridia bacterium]|nr:hypothetical protein [Clostridia bacterium]